ncbi:DUF1697 domain-containing protein [Altericroceibacterium spongiae]|uniref:DUF1697 domain-containing protein n=1 Tax=Altericroceibacterium spongiae TaxID=2320269 RepID=A0A420EQW3_9SPHN|nr:DUF1697 domain-containing protein [Altericroceibacterium spongiae]RKF23051.1 DUF1697 domain-containing protein [Altericroceibacterium spongiae]
MKQYVAFLGSINVGGNRLKMVDLRDALEREEFTGVETVVASGNVLFTHEARPSEGLSEKIAYVLREYFSIDSFAVVCDRFQLGAAIDNNPFAADGEDNLVHTHFLEQSTTQTLFDAMLDAYQGRGPERLALGDDMVFIDYAEGVGRSRLTPGFLERRLGTRGTARNIRSLRRILDKMVV